MPGLPGATKAMKQRIGAALSAGELSSEAAVRACFERIEARDGQLRSFVSVRDKRIALAEAKLRDAESPRGPLHGVPFAVKDIFETAELPTQYGSPYYRDFQPAKDAAAVELLRQAGAVLIGKLATVEFAGIGACPDTRHPDNPQFSPGGSSIGSGAAVGAGLVPLALATQTGGSTIRPAAFCGVAGMKPTWGRVSTEGMKPFAPGLDTVGWIAEDSDMLARAADALTLAPYDAAKVSGRLRIGVYPTPYIDAAQPEALDAVEQTTRLLAAAGHRVEQVAGPDGAERLNEWQDMVMFGEGQAALLAEYRRDPSLAHPGVRDLVENRKGITTGALTAAQDAIAALRPAFDAAMDGFDAWLTPPVPGIATRLEDGDGLATFNRLFTALHLPCITLPGFRGPHELPVGVQLVAPRHADARLLAVSKRVESLLSQH